MRKFLLVYAFVGLSLPAHATEDARMTSMPYDPAPTGQDCKMIETATFGVNIANVSVEIGNAKKYMDERIAAIEAAARELGMQKFEIQSSNMSVYSNNYNTGCGQPAAAPAQYMLSGGVSYTMEDIAKASELAKKVEAMGLQVNLNTNAYRQCQ